MKVPSLSAFSGWGKVLVVLLLVVSSSLAKTNQLRRTGQKQQSSKEIIGIGLGGEVSPDDDQELSSSEGLAGLRQLNADAYIFRQRSDGFAQGTGGSVGQACSTSSTVSFVSDPADQDFMQISTNPWHSGGYRMDCVAKVNYVCVAQCQPFPNPTFSQWKYLTFQAKVIAGSGSCDPTMSLVKRYPMYSSNVVTLKGSRVKYGSLVDWEWRTVVINITEFSTAEWPTVDGVKDIYFRNCGTAFSSQPVYKIRGLKLTDTAIPLLAAPETNVPSKAPSSTPTKSTSVPTDSPTSAYWPIWENASQSHTVQNASLTCFEQLDRLGITNSRDAETGIDFFSITPDPWVSGGIRFGCLAKDSSWNCIASCYPWDTTVPNWSSKQYLTFLAKVAGTLTQTCQPTIQVTGGGWPRLSSNPITLQGSYVDGGYLSSTEWRRVLIPMDQLKTPNWDLSQVYGLYFLTCGTEHSGLQPTYSIAELAVTNNYYDLGSSPPSSSPTVYVTNDPLEATHRYVYAMWFPILGSDREPASHTWIVAQNNEWPSSPATTTADHTVTVHIPSDQTVVYSGMDAIKYDKIIVEGTLFIRPNGSGVALTASTIAVEPGGTLHITTENSSTDYYTVTVNIDGTLDQTLDPEEIMLGIVSKEGNLKIQGDAVPTKMALLSQAVQAGNQFVVLEGANLGFVEGGEVVLPDTQIGLDVSSWKFSRSSYVDQTELCHISSTVPDLFAGVTTLICTNVLQYDHTQSSTVAYMTRSITIRTASSNVSTKNRGHIFHTGNGTFEVRNARLEQLGRTTTELIDSTIMRPDPNFKFGSNTARMNVSKNGVNQIARYALHAHHSLVESYFTGNAVLFSPRDGMVAHNSRVHITDNVIVGANGTGIFLEDATETGPVLRNYIIGTGGGTRGHDDGRFAIQSGLDMAHGGFGIWCRGKLALVQDNHCEGHFGMAAYSFFVHPNFVSLKKVPNVPGTPPELAGKTLKEISKVLSDSTGAGLQLQTYGGFVNNSAKATFQAGIDLSYFSVSDSDPVGSIVQGATIIALAQSGRGISTTHSRLFTLDHVNITAVAPAPNTAAPNNSIVGIWCNNCNGCTLATPNTSLVIENVLQVRGGNC